MAQCFHIQENPTAMCDAPMHDKTCNWYNLCFGKNVST